ncbi:SMP-30/gluconolactonase/LRE family protein [Alkalitalea saponilacus]|uniref:Gluconolactonase n=1 Tax=Alkalitalea saponilacus TaxID=889453 RepID=A0A1T5HS05_9BACT|nr:SMP-30/gluconolactonase/LRE family protein [Alkalitalea saponilacus]ASB50030.1 gluconolactonase [Alkalitalea saponilacus]SKC23455.1 gluconolactonase [Alkalitalea saponilacus]
MRFIYSICTLLILGLVVFGCSNNQKTSIIAEGATLELVADTFSFTEGPAPDRYGNVYFTDQPNDRILIWSIDGEISLFMDGSGRSNGLYFDNDGYLLACADEKNELWSINTNTGQYEVLVSNFEGYKLNGPNDLWIDSKGGVYFTDPYYKRDYWVDPTQELMQENVYYLLPDRSDIIIVDDQMVKPNGIIGAPDGKTLYVADIGDDKTYRYDINPDGSLSNRQLFCELGSDGMTIDNRGNVYLTGDGVTVFNSAGEKIEHFKIEEHWTANVTFGGADQNILFITAMGSVYTIEMNVKGVRY